MDALDHHTCYQAISRRDARFDGRFYTAVTTTGIFCRPSCPARTPKSTNVRFYGHAAAASEAGFRPCRRCRPELAPGHPEWNRREDLVGKAMRLIEAGTVDRLGVSGLAAELGVSERHLRRELQAVVGAGPLQLARARRLWLARMLLDQTRLSVTDVAFASGFGSVRQFNDAIRTAFDAPPSALRRRRDIAPGPEPIELQLPCRGALGWSQLQAFFAARAIPGLEEATPTGLRRMVPGGWVELDSPLTTGTVALGSEPLRVRCSLRDLSVLAELLPTIRSVADLDTDLEPVAAELAADPDLAERLTSTSLPRLPGTFDPFELVVRAIVGQQVSVAGARTLLGQLVRLVACGSKGGELDDGRGHAAEPVEMFPTAETVASADLSTLGMPTRRRDTITGVARAVVDGRLDLSRSASPEALQRQLVDLPGIGPWTAGYVTMRVLGDSDAWPTNDLGLRRSLGIDAAALERRAENWRPWRAYAALLLWHTDPTTTTKPARSAS
ncbi:MAG: Ada metal-binding domain-containing protein [Actinomycetota bacterium]